MWAIGLNDSSVEPPSVIRTEVIEREEMIGGRARYNFGTSGLRELSSFSEVSDTSEAT